MKERGFRLTHRLELRAAATLLARKESLCKPQLHDTLIADLVAAGSPQLRRHAEPASAVF